MTKITDAAKRKACELANTSWRNRPGCWLLEDVGEDETLHALARFIQETSDVAKVAADRADFEAGRPSGVRDILDPLILPDEPDPLLGVVEEAIAGTAEKGAAQLREVLAKRGLKIVEAIDD